MRVADLEVLFTANTASVEKAEKQVKATGEKIEKRPVTVAVAGDEKGALQSMGRVEAEAKKLVSKDTAITVNANVDRADKNIDRTQKRLDYLRSVETTLDVQADVKRAEASLARFTRQRDALVSARAEMVLDVDDNPARQKLEDVAGFAEDAGTDGGERGGNALSGGIVAALLSIPIAGAIVGIGASLAEGISSEFQDALQLEVGVDRLQGLTGISEASALRLGRIAGEAYANVFGESIEANMDTTRLALQFDLIDEKSTNADAQKVVEGLSGIAGVLGEEVQPIARAVTQMLRTGLVKSADEAFDVLAAGAREGVNASEDLLDTFTEYGTHFRDMGLSAEEALGLLNQGLDGGAFNADKVADALKELTIRVKDLDDEAASGALTTLGLDAKGMSTAFTEGGPAAREGLEQILSKLKEVEDPATRAGLAVDLFGTQAEDMAQALGALDLTTAVAQLGGVEGAAQKMFDTLSDNDATKLEGAKRNIEVALDGIKGSLATAFSEPLGGFADWVAQNRGPLMQFLLDLANGALDFGVATVEAAAAGTESFGEFVSGPLADTVQGMAGVIKALSFGSADTSGIDQLAEDMRGFKDSTDVAAHTLRTGVVGGIEDARSKMNEFGEGAVNMGYLHDASMRVADAVGAVGLAADGTQSSLQGIDLANLSASESGVALESQLRSAIAAMGEEVSAAAEAGESQEALAQRYNTSRDALIDQMMQMGATREEAQSLIDTVMKTPESATTSFSSNAKEEQRKVQDLENRVVTLSDGSVRILANTSDAYSKLMSIQTLLRDITGNKSIHVGTGAGGQGGLTMNDGGLVEFMHNGGVRGLTPMSPVAQSVPPNTWRVVGDRGDVPELYIPLDGSARSLSIMLEGMRLMGLQPMASGDVVGSRTSAPPAVQASHGQLIRDLIVQVPEGTNTAGVVDSLMFELGRIKNGGH